MTLTRLRTYRPALAVLLLPSLLLIGVFSYYPAVRSLIGGFYAWNGFSPPTWAGVSQFTQYLKSPTVRPEVINIAILTGREKGKARESTLMGLADGSIDILVGTHAIFQQADGSGHSTCHNVGKRQGKRRASEDQEAGSP